MWADRGLWAMVTRTGVLVPVRFTILLVALTTASCSRHQPAETYESALADYFRGDLKRAAAATHQGAERSREGPDPALYWNFRLLESEVLVAQARTAETEALLTQPVPPRAELEQLEVRRLIDLTSVSNGSQVAVLLPQARKRATAPELLIRICLGEGSMALDENRPKAANDAFHAALQLANRQSDPYWRPMVLKNLCYSSRRQNRYEESIEFGLQALAAAEKMGYRRLAAQARMNLVSAYRYLGDFESALLNGKQAIGVFQAIGARGDLMTSLGELGLVYDTMDDPKKAIACHQQAYEVANELDRRRDAARHAENLATSLIRNSQWDAAEVWNHRASDLAAAAKAKVEIPFLKRNEARIQDGLGHEQEAIRICQEILQSDSTDAVIQWAVYDFLGEIYGKQKRVNAKRTNSSGAALRVTRGVPVGDRQANYRITLLSRLIPFFQERVDFLASQKDDAVVLRAVESSRARALAEGLGRPLTPQQLPDLAWPPEVRQIREFLVAVLLVCSQAVTFAWLIAANGTKRFDLPPIADVEKLVARYRDIVEHSIQDPTTANQAAGPALWNVLMAEIARWIPKNSRVIVIPDGSPLHRLNLRDSGRSYPPAALLDRRRRTSRGAIDHHGHGQAGPRGPARRISVADWRSRLSGNVLRTVRGRQTRDSRHPGAVSRHKGGGARRVRTPHPRPIARRNRTSSG